MGNTVSGGSKKTTKIMNIEGETRKVKTPIQAMEITKDHPGHVLLDSESVKQFGVRAKAVEPGQYLEAKRVYFLVELPKFPEDEHREPRRVRSSGIHMSAKERLETLMLSRRSISDLSSMNPAGTVVVDQPAQGAVRVKMRLPRAEVEKLVRESKDNTEAAEKIMDLYMDKAAAQEAPAAPQELPPLRRQAPTGKSPLGQVPDGYEKRVSFMPSNEGEAQLAVLAS